MIDLNSTSQASARLNWHIDRALVAKVAAEPARDYLGASLVGDACERAVQYGFLRAEPDPGREVDGDLARIFERGRWAEVAATGWLRAAGFVLLDVDPATGGQFAFSALDGRVRGHTDGLIVFWRGEGEPPLQLPAGWECKCLGAKYWRALSKEKVRFAHPRYFGQMQVYMGELRLDRYLFTAVNADTMELYHEVVDFEPAVHAALMERARRVLQACDLGEMVPRGQPSQAHFRCKMCAFSMRCWA